MSNVEQPNKIDVLDHGFVELVDYMGSDLTVVNSARVSFGVEKKEVDEADKKLIKFLLKEAHFSPFRHAQISFKCKAPKFLTAQIYKHIVGIGYTEGTSMREVDHAWNEKSFRYSNASDVDYYIPEKFRKQSKNNKQCSVDEPIVCFSKADLEGTFFEGLSELSRTKDENVNPEYYSVDPLEVYINAIEVSKEAYSLLIGLGVAKEQARGILPSAFYTEFVWTVSLQAVLNFIKLRDHEGSQYEIREYAKAMRTLVEQKFPVSLKAFEELSSD
jgi:thymidylate synthase (FAD)